MFEVVNYKFIKIKAILLLLFIYKYTHIHTREPLKGRSCICLDVFFIKPCLDSYPITWVNNILVALPLEGRLPPTEIFCCLLVAKGPCQKKIDTAAAVVTLHK